MLNLVELSVSVFYFSIRLGYLSNQTWTMSYIVELVDTTVVLPANRILKESLLSTLKAVRMEVKLLLIVLIM